MLYFRVMGVGRVLDSQNDLQGHSRSFPVSLPLKLCLYLVPFPRYCQLNVKISRDLEHIPFRE